MHQITLRGYRAAEVSRRLGVRKYSLYKWSKPFGEATAKPGVDHEAENRVARLARLAGVQVQIGDKKQPGVYGGRPSVAEDNTLDRQFAVAAPDRAA